MDILGSWPVKDCLDFAWFHSDALRGNDVSEEADFLLHEFTLRELAVQTILTKDLQNLAEVLKMFIRCLAVDQDVIEEDDHEVIEVRSEHLLHQVHERCRSVCQTKRKDTELEVSVTSAKCCLLDVLIRDSDLVVSTAKVDFAEE